MGIRKSLGKNKKSKRPVAAVAVKREEARRQAAAERGKSRPQGMR
jgi:hypothetical protein